MCNTNCPKQQALKMDTQAVIDAAVLKERERCRQIALTFAAADPLDPNPGANPFDRGWMQAAARIGAAIVSA